MAIFLDVYWPVYYYLFIELFSMNLSNLFLCLLMLSASTNSLGSKFQKFTTQYVRNYFLLCVLNLCPVTSAGCSSFVRFGEKRGEGSGKNFVLAAIHFFQVKNKISKQGHNTTQNVRAWHNSMSFSSTPTQICKHSPQNSMIKSLMKRQSTLQCQRPLP